MNENALDDQILAPIRDGQSKRKQIMQIDTLRMCTWAAIDERLNFLTKGGAMVASKSGLRIGNLLSRSYR